MLSPLLFLLIVVPTCLGSFSASSNMIRPRASASDRRGKNRGARHSVCGIIIVLLSPSSPVVARLLSLVFALFLFYSARVV